MGIGQSMTALAIFLFAAFVLASFGQILFAWIYSRRVRDYRVAEVPEDRLPKAAVILCLRGADPFLEECLERVAQQDYPRFVVRVIVDGPEDPARGPVERWAVRHPELPVSIEFLREPFPTCTLYCSSIYQAVGGLDELIEAVAFVNADTLPHPAWLRSLVVPLLDERIGAVTGNRWYVPAVGKMGSLVRCVQNASMVLVMYFLNLTWGGSLSLKRAVFGHPDFFQKLRRASCEDHAIREVLKLTGLKVVFSPAVMMVNREECDLGSGFHFLRRQVLWTRLYHEGWSAVIEQACLVAAFIAAAVACFWTGVAFRQWAASGWVLGGSLVALLANLMLLGLLQRTIGRRVEADQGEPMAGFRGMSLAKLAAAAPLALFVYLAAVFSAARARRVNWRGISYQVVPPDGVRLIEYREYRQPRAAATQRLSL